MSEQNYEEADSKSQVEQCCPNMPESTRTMWFVILIVVGFIMFAVGSFNVALSFLGNTSGYCISFGSIFILISNLFKMSCKAFIAKLKEPKRLIVSIIYLSSIAATLFCQAGNHNKLLVVASVTQMLSGIWYLLSYTESGQSFVLNCFKSCCCKKSDNDNNEGA